MNELYYGDNLEVMQNHIPDQSVDLCYIDPPFNSNRDYNQIYNNIGKEDKAQRQAFIDTWEWDAAAIQGLKHFDLAKGKYKNFEKTCKLILALDKILEHGSMLAYLISITQRIIEIHRILKPTGSFYLHCDPTASHYLKLILDSVFCTKGGDFQNEIVWCYKERELSKKRYNKKHDIILFYTKSNIYTFNYNHILEPYSDGTKRKFNYTGDDGRAFQIRGKGGQYTGKQGLDISLESTESDLVYRDYFDKSAGVLPRDWVTIPIINRAAKERLGYPTQKPEKLLERIILASSNEKDVVLDAYCGCGTTVAVAQRLKRKWIGIDITYQSITLILKRLEETFGKKILKNISVLGIPKDIESAKDLALKSASRKEFEIWAVMTYSNNKAVPNEKKGADKGIDGKMYITTSVSPQEYKPILFSVKSGNVSVAQVRDFMHVINREEAAAGVFITLETPTKPMVAKAKDAGEFLNPLTNTKIPKLQIVTIGEIIKGERENFHVAVEVLNRAERKFEDNQIKLEF